jgi:two-component sensor histidine kinase
VHSSSAGEVGLTTFPLVGSAHSEAEALVAVLRRLSCARSLDEVMDVVTHATRVLLRADGVTFVLRDGDLCHYADEDAIAPLWKGRRFPMSACISGWCMEHNEAVAIPDILEDPRIPQDAYLPTFVKSLAMVPVRQEDPVAVIGAYWAEPHLASPEDMERLQTIANASALALAFVSLRHQHAERIRAEEILQKHAATLNALLENIPEGITIASGPDVTIERVSAHGLRRIHRSEEDVSAIDADKHPHAWQVFDKKGTRQLSADELPLTRAAKFGEVAENVQLNLKLPDGSLLPILCNAGPIRDGKGKITGGIIAWRDISELAKADETLRLVVRELDHRVKNLFSLMIAMIGLTAKHSTSVKEMADTLRGRVLALSRAHALIRPAFIPDAGAEENLLGDLIAALVRPHLPNDTAHLHLSGPDFPIASNSGASLALILHELATNAAKYGAFSKAQGCVSVDWQEKDGQLLLAWSERDGPAVNTEPKGLGFGSQLIHSTVNQLGGTIHFDWRPTGLQVDLAIPIGGLRE